ncbi:EAL domain-containing protein [Roseomonas sp. M0104]|uniref:EAL domain-containing protein n=1 Tax=Teichococcus coralli TaxID=2545983 RepID=A0A845BI98_9PROT|nr:EAL domain-containing protein [Pseudoroseomonas coralli]MXP65810.1 EAL domain-containing protein [Pseudoroseomonas coralli]
MSIRLKILLGCLALTTVTVALGTFTRTAQRELGAITTQLYDDSFLAMSYLRAAQNGLLRAEARIRQPEDTAAASANAPRLLAQLLQEIADDLEVARNRATSPEAAAVAERLGVSLRQAGELAAAPQADSMALAGPLAAAERDFDVAIEIYAADGFRQRREAGLMVENTVRRAWWAMGLSVAVALLITLVLTRSIVPALRRALQVADAIAAGRLDNQILVRGRGEPAQLLRALAVMQSSIAAAMERIHALMQSQASHHAGEIALQNARLDAALSNMVQGLCLFAPDGRLVMVNRRFTEMFGAPAPGAAPGELLSPQGLAALLPPAGIAAEATTAQLPDGRWISVVHRPVEGGGWVATYEDVTERKQAEARLAHMARHDALTGLPNRAAFREQMARALARVRRGEGVAVLCLDLDRFKAVNDSLGHPAGDALLQAVAARLRDCVRETDLVVRLGGDEFAVVQEGASLPAEAAAVAGRIIAALSAPFGIGGHHVTVGTSIGIALAGLGTTDADVLLRCADLALYRAKEDGRGAFRFFEPSMDEQMRARRDLEMDLGSALARGELALFYQPLVDTEQGRVGGFEALLRWQHPVRGTVSPAAFIPLAEETGMIAAIGAWVIRRACADAACWPLPVKVAVNLSPVQFRDRSLPRIVAEALAESGLDPARLELEITESLLLLDDEKVLEILHGLRAQGVRIAMDDFGTGYSSLSYLRRFPFDKIKIDQSFVRGMMEQEDCAAIVSTVVSLGRLLGMSVNAEGVETREQFLALREQGCGEVQGYLFSPPRPAEEVVAMLGSIRQDACATDCLSPGGGSVAPPPSAECQA